MTTDNNNKIDVNQLIMDTASVALKIQRDNGSFPFGHKKIIFFGEFNFTPQVPYYVSN